MDDVLSQLEELFEDDDEIIFDSAAYLPFRGSAFHFL